MTTRTVQPKPSLPELQSPRRAECPPHAAARRWRTDFVGRDDEIDRLRHCLGGGCRLVGVLGESGIGKTRLVSELVKSLEPGTAVSWGRCSQDDLGSYLPFVEIIRHISGRLGGRGARSSARRPGRAHSARAGVDDPCRTARRADPSGSGQRAAHALRRGLGLARSLDPDAAGDRRPALGRRGHPGLVGLPGP